MSGQQLHYMATSTTSASLHGPVVMSDAAGAVLFDGAVVAENAAGVADGGRTMHARELNGVDAPAGGVGIPDCSGGLGGTGTACPGRNVSSLQLLTHAKRERHFRQSMRKLHAHT